VSRETRARQAAAGGLRALEQPAGAADEERRAADIARWIFEDFDAYYAEARRIPARGKDAFERRDPRTSLALSKKRLSLYSVRIEELGARLKQACPWVTDDERIWDQVEAHYLPLTAGRYEADLAYAYMNSVRRKISQNEWKPVAYSFSAPAEARPRTHNEVYRIFPVSIPPSSATMAEILQVPDFAVPYRDLAGDARRVAERLERALRARGGKPAAVEVINAGFYRNRGAYLVGRVVSGGGQVLMPLIVAFINEERGVYVDAVLSCEADAHNLFSSTLANFHVTNSYYHELSMFLHSIMPERPLGLHYSTIGYNHVGKVAVMNELKRELTVNDEVFETSVGFRGSVAIGFSSPSSAYNLKVIRDHPTSQYKWGRFEGIDSVLRKYGQVHEINRTGSMLDNIIYYNLKLERQWFDPALLEELLEQASQSVSLRNDDVIFKYLIVQRRVTPIPVFLETASEQDAETVMVNLGYCIKNNAAANIFNKDLDVRNYGVSKYLKVYLFDYDALEPLIDVKIRSNQDQVEGEEDIPDWYFEDGVVFLPEEIEANLRIPRGALRELFRAVHGDLLTTDYWERMQRDLQNGYVPSIRVYPESCKLRSAAA